MQLKFCGITQAKDLKLAAKLNADYIGFIFYPKSPRYISLQNAKNILQNNQLQNSKPVGVFVDADLQSILHTVHSLNLKAVQMHSEKILHQPNDLRSLQKTNVEVWKVLRLNIQNPPPPPQQKKTIRQLLQYNALLLDAKLPLTNPANQEIYGGTGKSIDASTIKTWIAWAKNNHIRLILAGGLTFEKIKNLLNLPQLPYAIDVNSGVETSPGVKNHAKMKNVATLIKSIHH